MPLSEIYIASDSLPKYGLHKSEKTSELLTAILDTTLLNDRKIIIANGKGVRIFNQERINQLIQDGWICRFPAGTTLPEGLKIVEQSPGEFYISPERNMAERQFIALLKEMSLRAITIFKRADRAVQI
ncbi:hypothetical protein ACJJIG_18905 [Microbulbifer sp. SSSA007]|uniref:hypothetical protein n=1 Tax=Microbulbifer sp. SSSA007 TaxID=3243379 RepID=UPI004039D835